MVSDSSNSNQNIDSSLIGLNTNNNNFPNNDNFQSLRGFQFAQVNAQSGFSDNVMQNIDVVNFLENILEGENNNQNLQDGGAQHKINSI